MTTRPKQHFDDMPLAQQAGILCNDARFQTFAARRSGAPTDQLCASAAAEYLRRFCWVKSRRDLNTNQTAQNQFQRLRTEFDAWAGKIARPQ